MNVLRANILAMLRFQSVVTVSLLNKIKFYNHNAVSVCVCLFLSNRAIPMLKFVFSFFYHDQKSLHFGCNLKIALHICFWIRPPKMQATFFLFLDAFFQATTGTGNSMLFSRTHELSWKYIYM